MKVLLVDDEPLARNELKYLLNQCKGIASIQEASTVQEALEILLIDSIDLLFLDIQLTDETGMDLAEKLTKVSDSPEIVFATAYDNYAIDAFEKNARDYILKPFEFERVQEAVERVKRSIDYKKERTNKEVEKRLPRKSVPIQEQERIVMVEMNDILAIEVSQGETMIYAKEAEYHTQETLTSWEEKLDKHHFMRVHRSFIVQIDAIREIQPWFNHTYQLTLTKELKIPVSRSYMKKFRDRMGL